MIKSLEINNFKSIEHIKMDCKKINIFIGKPNSGKSNILEGIGMFSIPHVNDYQSIIRCQNMADLFTDKDINRTIEIKADNLFCKVYFKDTNFIASGWDLEKNIILFQITPMSNESKPDPSMRDNWNKPSIKYYKFASLGSYPKEKPDFLLPPNGENLLSILYSHKELRTIVADLFKTFGFSLLLDPYSEDKKIELQKDIDGIKISYPYILVSDTLQRIVFYLAIIETNTNSTIILEEPEGHTFPFYTKDLAERIALDKTNQYFISTHNPWILLPILEKADKKDIGIFVTYFKEYRTQVRPIKEQEIDELLDLDASVFFNLERFLE